MKDLTDRLGGVNAKTILEIGCGNGSFLRHLVSTQPHVERVVGVDVVDPRTTVEADMLARPDHEWIEAAGHAVPFADKSFDMVCIAHVLHHLEPARIGDTLAEMKRVLRPGGVFLLYEMYRDGQTDAQRSHVRYHHWIAEVDRLTGTHHYPTFLRAELMHIVDSLDLRELEIEDFNEAASPAWSADKAANLLHKIENRLEKIRPLPEFPAMEAKAREISTWISAHGVAAPTRLIVTGRA